MIRKRNQEGKAAADTPKDETAAVAEAGDPEVGAVTTSESAADSAPITLADRAKAGPFDDSEANRVRPYIDLGGIKVLPRDGLNLRLEVEEQTKRIVAVGLDYADSTLQVQPFAAPRTSGLWDETRDQIRDQVRQQGGRVDERVGPLGAELLAQVPVSTGDGSVEKRLARFIGVDGPRWFLRGVIGGEATTSPEKAAQIEDLFRSIVVVRGTAPMPPRDLIPLKVPATPGAS